MSTKLLIVEDSPADADLMVRTLERAGMATTALVVQDEAGLRRGLADFEPNVVLADSSLPRFSGEEALAIVREGDPFLPVILVTGTLDEDRLAQLMDQGLDDYVLKDRLLRLPPAVRHAVLRCRERKDAVRASKSLEASERRFRAVAEASGDALLVADQKGRIVFWNPAATRMFGYEPADILGSDVVRLIPPELRDRHLAGWKRVTGGESVPGSHTFEATASRADGSEFPVELTISAWAEESDRFFSAQIRDVAQRREEARMRNLLSQVVEQNSASVVVTDVDGRIEYVNPAFEALTGYALEEVQGQTPRVLNSGYQSGEYYGRMWGEIKAGRTFLGEFVNRKRDGSEYHQRSVVFPIVGQDGRIERLVGIGQDITKEKSLEEQFHQAQKMEAVGQLAGGIAHDFNNLLTGVLTNAQLLEISLEGRGEEEELVRDVISATRRGADLVRRLMALSRENAQAPRRVDLREVVAEAAKTIRRILPESIEMRLDLSDDAVWAVVDEGGLHHVLMNLANNARDAMPGGGRLALRVTPAEGQSAGMIEVFDNGEGMPPEVLAEIWEPFFTTKQVGKGTGLGLAMVRGFVKAHSGHVEAHSTPGGGTRIQILLPLDGGGESPAVGEANDRVKRIPPAAPAGSSRGTILVAEDQAPIRQVAVRALGRLGYRVIEAANGVEAMRMLAKERGTVRLVLADMIMPGGGGGMLYRNTRDWPDRPRFLFTSGYGTDELNGDGTLLRSGPFLAKPWSLRDLETAVADILDNPLEQ